MNKICFLFKTRCVQEVCSCRTELWDSERVWVRDFGTFSQQVTKVWHVFFYWFIAFAEKESLLVCRRQIWVQATGGDSSSTVVNIWQKASFQLQCINKHVFLGWNYQISSNLRTFCRKMANFWFTRFRGQFLSKIWMGGSLYFYMTGSLTLKRPFFYGRP